MSGDFGTTRSKNLSGSFRRVKKRRKAPKTGGFFLLSKIDKEGKEGYNKATYGIRQRSETMGQKETIWNKDFIIVFLVNIVAYMGFQMLNPNITKYASSLGIVSTLVGIIAAVYSFAACFPVRFPEC